MPYTEHEKKLDRMKDWRRERTKEYHKWLYERRLLNKRIATLYEQTLVETIEAGDPGAATRAFAALQEARRLAKAIGNRFDHKKNKPYWKE